MRNDHFDSKTEVRQAVWDALVEAKAARFPFPTHGRIPNFVGAPAAAARLLDHPFFEGASRLKVNPDSPQRAVRAEALRRGITVFVPTPRLRGGFKRLDPQRIPADKVNEAASLSKGDRWAEAVPPEITGTVYLFNFKLLFSGRRRSLSMLPLKCRPQSAAKQ